MRTLSPEGQQALQDGAETAMFVAMYFNSGTLRLNTSRSDVEDQDSPVNVYTGTGLLGSIGPVDDKVSEIGNMQFTLAGVDPAVIAIALQEAVRGRTVEVFFGIFDRDTRVLLDLTPVWAGRISTMQLSQEKDSATVQVTAEHRGVLFSRPKPLRYTDSDQQRLYPGDRCLEFLVSQSQAQDIWPAASFFKV